MTTLPLTPPQAVDAYRPVRRGSAGWSVYAVQSALNDAAGAELDLDGSYGSSTRLALERFQERNELAADGVAGPATKQCLVDAVCRRLNRTLPALPSSLARSLARGEGGDELAAVNWSVAGGVDCGLYQQRVLGPPYRTDRLRLAFAPYRAGAESLGVILTRSRAFANPHFRCPFTPIELAVLAHNWPWAAQTYHRDGRLPSPSKPASWVPASLPSTARTYDGWAHFYVRSMTRVM